MPRLLKRAASNLVRKPFTRQYPFEKPEVAERFRGLMKLDLDKCVGCGLCARDCPAGAIEMRFYPHANRRVPVFHVYKCVFCYQCADSCPMKAITPTKVFELSSYSPKELIIAPRPEEVKPRPKPKSSKRGVKR